MKVMAPVQATFRDRTLDEECACQTVIMIPKVDRREFRGVDLMEVLWNTTTGIINQRLTLAIGCHDTLNIFWAGRRTETATLEAKLIQHIMAKRKAVLHDIFLDLHKEHKTLNRERLLDIMDGYSVGPRTLRLLQTYWGRLQMVAKARGYYVPTFKGYRRVNQGDPLPPTIFNVVMDGVIRHLAKAVDLIEAGEEGIGETVQDLAEYFYNDGLIVSPRTEWLQR